MTLYLDDCAREAIAQHGEGGYPNEVCGILLGKEEGGRRVVRLTMPIENSFEQDEQYHRFLITPADMFRAERLARYERLDVLGVYHSHPDAPARPSEYDREHAAWTTWSYFIVSIQGGKAADIRAWKLRDDRSAYDEEEVEVNATSRT